MSRRYDRPQLTVAVRMILEVHVGPDNTISMVELFKAATGEVVMPGKRYDQTRIIRSIIDRLRAEGFAVCFDGKGYFLPRDNDDLESTVRLLESRAIASFRTAANLRRCSVRDLLRHYQRNLPIEETPDG